MDCQIEDEIPHQIGMEVVRLMAGHSLEKSGVPVEPAEIFHQIIIHLFRVPGMRADDGSTDA